MSLNGFINIDGECSFFAQEHITLQRFPYLFLDNHEKQSTVPYHQTVKTDYTKQTIT